MTTGENGNNLEKESSFCGKVGRFPELSSIFCKFICFKVSRSGFKLQIKNWGKVVLFKTNAMEDLLSNETKGIIVGEVTAKLATSAQKPPRGQKKSFISLKSLMGSNFYKGSTARYQLLPLSISENR